MQELEKTLVREFIQMDKIKSNFVRQQTKRASKKKREGTESPLLDAKDEVVAMIDCTFKDLDDTNEDEMVN